MLFLFLLNIILSLFTQNSEQDIINAVNKKLADYDSVVITHLQMPKNYSDLVINEKFDIRRSGNYCYVPVKVTINGVSTNSFVQVEFNVYKKVLVSKLTIKKDEEISSKNVESVLTNVTFAKGNFLTDVDTLIKMKSKIQISPGEVLYEELLSKVPIVLKGSNVVLNNVRGNVVVSVDAIAKQDGALGDIITVQTTDRKQFKGKVLDSNNILKVE